MGNANIYESLVKGSKGALKKIKPPLAIVANFMR
jgi:hypothetical protein